jgi:hypothetical protein
MFAETAAFSVTNIALSQFTTSFTARFNLLTAAVARI